MTKLVNCKKTNMCINDPDPYYVYFSYEIDGRGYIGIHKYNKSGIDPLDDGYFGSQSDSSFNPKNKVILYENLSISQALEKEVLLHNIFNVDTNPAFANRAKQTSTGFFYVAKGPQNYQYNTGNKYDFFHPNHGYHPQTTCSYLAHTFGLQTSSLLLLAKKQINTHLGWVIYGEPIPPTALKHYIYNWSGPNGEKVMCNAKDLAKKYNLNLGKLIEVLQNKRGRKTCKGWYATSCQLAAQIKDSSDLLIV